MKSFLELANDKPKLSKQDLDVIDRAHDQQKDAKVLRKDGLQDMARMERFGFP